MFMNPDKYTKLTDQYYFEQREKSVLFLPASLSFRVKRGTYSIHNAVLLSRSAGAQGFFMISYYKDAALTELTATSIL
jgi:hypothetical protein